MTQLKDEWQKVFKYAVTVAKDMCKKNPSIKYSEAMSRAWKDPKVLAKRKEYEKKKDAHTKAPKKVKKPVTKKPTKKPAAKKPTKKPVKKPAAKKPTKKVAKKTVKKVSK